MNSLAAAVERSGDSRILRRLRPKDCFANANPGNPFIGIVIDAETTGMSPSADEVIELGMFKFEYSCDGQIYRVVDSFPAGSARRAGTNEHLSDRALVFPAGLSLDATPTRQMMISH